MRKFGKSDTQVSALCLGTIDITEQQVVFHACNKWGVTHWDTALVTPTATARLV